MRVFTNYQIKNNTISFQASDDDNDTIKKRLQNLWQKNEAQLNRSDISTERRGILLLRKAFLENKYMKIAGMSLAAVMLVAGIMLSQPGD